MQIFNISSTEVLILDAVLTLNKTFQSTNNLQELACLERPSQSKSYKNLQLNIIIKLPDVLDMPRKHQQIFN